MTVPLPHSRRAVPVYPMICNCDCLLLKRDEVESKMLEGVTSIRFCSCAASTMTCQNRRAKIGRTEVRKLVADHNHGFDEIDPDKRVPDAFLVSAAANAFDAAACFVLNNILPGIAAARAVAIDQFHFAPDGHNPSRNTVGTAPFDSIFEHPGLIDHAWRRA